MLNLNACMLNLHISVLNQHAVWDGYNAAQCDDSTCMRVRVFQMAAGIVSYVYIVI
jgi:hypothetical protein